MSAIPLSEFIQKNNSINKDDSSDTKIKKIKLLKDVKDPIINLEHTFVNLTYKGFFNKAYNVWKVSKDNGLSLDVTIFDNISLVNGCRFGNIEFINWYINLNKKLTYSEKLKDTLFYEACLNDQLETVMFIFEHIIDTTVIRIDKENHSLFRKVCEKNCIKVATWLTHYYPEYKIEIDNGKIFDWFYPNSSLKSTDDVFIKSIPKKSQSTLDVMEPILEKNKDNESVFSDVSLELDNGEECASERDNISIGTNDTADTVDTDPEYEYFKNYDKVIEQLNQVHLMSNKPKKILPNRKHVKMETPLNSKHIRSSTLLNIKQIRPQTPLHIKRTLTVNNYNDSESDSYISRYSSHNSINKDTYVDRFNEDDRCDNYLDKRETMSEPMLIEYSSKHSLSDDIKSFKDELSEHSDISSLSDSTDSTYLSISSIDTNGSTIKHLDKIYSPKLEYDKEFIKNIDEFIIANKKDIEDTLKIHVEDRYTLCTIVGYDIPELNKDQIIYEEKLYLNDYETTYMKGVVENLKKDTKSIMPIPWLKHWSIERKIPIAFIGDISAAEYVIHKDSFKESKQLYLYTKFLTTDIEDIDLDSDIDIFIENEIGKERWANLSSIDKLNELKLLVPSIDFDKRLQKFGIQKIKNFVASFTDDSIKKIKDSRLKQKIDNVYDKNCLENLTERILELADYYDNNNDNIKNYILNLIESTHYILGLKSIAELLIPQHRYDFLVNISKLKCCTNTLYKKHNIKSKDKLFIRNPILMNYLTDKEIVDTLLTLDAPLSDDDVKTVFHNIESITDPFKKVIVIILLSIYYQTDLKIEKYFYWKNSIYYKIHDNDYLVQICRYAEAISVVGLNSVSKFSMDLNPLVFEEYFENWVWKRYDSYPFKHKFD